MNWGGAFAPLSFYKDREPDLDADDVGAAAGTRGHQQNDKERFKDHFRIIRITYDDLTEEYTVVVVFEKSPGKEYTFLFDRDSMPDKNKETIARLILAYWKD